MSTLTVTPPDLDRTPAASSLRWDPPGPGMWQRETTHVPGGATPVMQDIAPAAVAAGTARMAARYGLPISHVSFRFVNDRLFMRPIPAVGEKPRKAPPPPVLRVLSRLHPALRPRVRAAKQALASRQWRHDGEAWYSDRKPALTAQWLEFQAEPLDRYDDGQLVQHLDRLAAAASASIAEHFDLHGCDQIPVGDFLVACRAWGISDDEALSALRGSSPASLGDRDRLRLIADRVVASGRRPQTVEELRAIDPQLSADVDDYLGFHGWRVVTAYEPGGETLGELPGVLLASIRGAAERPGDPGADDERVAAMRQQVPTEQRARYDELLAEARFAWGIRDDHVGLTFLWPSGLLRRALLEVGDRLAQRGLSLNRLHALELHLTEVPAALAGAGPDAAGLNDRARLRSAHAAASAPYYIGAEPAPPSFDSFPPAMSRLTAGFVTCMDLWWNPRKRSRLAGSGVGAVAYTGTARVTASAEDAVARLRPGDVLVARYTTPAYNSALARAGAVVVEEGGPLCHAAIVARELGIPAVVGAVGAVSELVAGSMVAVDPVGGTVSMVSAR